MSAQRQPATEDLLLEDLARFELDPLGFTDYAYPWLEPGPLEEHDGLDYWQEDAMYRVGRDLEAGRSPILVATASGHGVGKSANVSQFIEWAMATCVDTRGVVTANTEAQLRTKTWPTLAGWHRMAITESLFEHEATSFRSTDRRHRDTWRMDAIPWSEQNTEAFAGLHNQGRRILLVFDEASAIPDRIWEVAEGALTDQHTQIIWLAYGNPTRNTGRFAECFRSRRHRWHTFQVDGRRSRFTNKALIAEWERDYGEDSDFFRVRVRGEFPRASVDQLIPSDVVEAARKAPGIGLPSDPLIIGIDVAAGGMDESVFAIRHGNDARTIRWRCSHEPDTMQTAARACALYDELRGRGMHVAPMFIDGGGIGKPVAQRIVQLGYPVRPVNFGGTADDPEQYVDKAAEMWVRMRDWLAEGGAIPDDPVLADQLTSRERDFDKRNRVRLEPKPRMRERGLCSPDRADALALTFAYPVGPAHSAAPGPNRHQTAYTPPWRRGSR